MRYVLRHVRSRRLCVIAPSAKGLFMGDRKKRTFYDFSLPGRILNIQRRDQTETNLMSIRYHKSMVAEGPSTSKQL